MAKALEPPMTNDNRQAESHIDAVEAGRVYGWAWDPVMPEQRQTVTVHHGEQALGTVVADRHRVDLTTRDIGDGRHAFVFDLPPTLRDRPAEEFTVSLSAQPSGGARKPKVFTINPDGAVVRQDKPEDDTPALRDPAEVAHELQTELKSIGSRLDQVDQNYAKMAQFMGQLDQRLAHGTKALENQIAGRAKNGVGQGQHQEQAPVTGMTPEEFKKLRQYVRVCWRDIKRLRHDLGSVELFTMRFDERLKEAAPQEEVESLRQTTKATRGVMWVAVILSGLALLLSIYAVFTG